jgi:predicted Zn-dependent protease
MLFGLAILLAACAGGSLPASHQVVPPDRPKPTQVPSDRVPASQAPADQVAAETEREHQRILAAYGGAYQDAKLEASIRDLVERLVAASDRPDLHYRVTILNSPAVNAFALPTGQLYVTRGLIALANDKAELASVLAHEMSHVIAQHAAIREDKIRQAALVDGLVNNVLSDPQSGALALARSKKDLATFSRTQEFEADSMGVGIAAKAGFDPYGAVRFLTAMGRNVELRPTSRGRDAHSQDFLSSHPATPERVTNALISARQHSAPGSGGRDRDDYLTGLDGLVFGEDPAEGFARGRRFLHPRLGFTFTAPEGFTLDNTAQAILGNRDGGGEALRLDVVQVPAEQKLGEYLTSGWIEKVDKSTVEELTISGLPAATALAKGDQWTFRLYAIRFGSDVYRFIFAGKHKTPEMDRAFRQSVGTFRRMSLTEIEQAKPLRLKIVTVAPGETIEQIARRMAVSDRQTERFRILNGLTSGQAPKPGDRVKIVVE